MSSEGGSLKIYFCGSICGGRQDQVFYEKIINHLKTYGKVLTEAIGNPKLTEQDEGLAVGKEKLMHDKFMERFDTADVVVAEVTQPSLGVGYELRTAVEKKKKTLCLFRPDTGKRLSCMIKGAQNEEGPFLCKDYSTPEEAIKLINSFLKTHVLNPETELQSTNEEEK